FCYTGSFEISAAMYGAKSFLGLDISQSAIDMCNKNAALNGVDTICRFECVNAFDVLREWAKEGRQWDVVMLDPPSFTKSRSSIDKAVAGYKEINLRGIKLVKPGGFLVTSSCTNLVKPGLFLDIIAMAAKDAKRKIRQVLFNAQSADHPIIRNQENTHYLKFLIVQVL
ncbi:MAG: class I SAM-dependent methyltransferase, partial [Ferruginibacter sp.]